MSRPPVRPSRPRGLLLDFYGTLVLDDDEPVSRITAAVSAAAGGAASAEQVGATWWSHFTSACAAARGPLFRPQRELAAESLQQTLAELAVDLDAVGLTALLAPAWRSPAVYPEAQRFLQRCALPVCVLSDIDRDEIEAALGHTALPVQHVVTSEDVRSYKPAPDGFHAAAAALGLPLAELWHVGDSLASDVAGASALQVTAVWVNRRAAPPPAGAVRPDVEVQSLDELLADLDARHP